MEAWARQKEEYLKDVQFLCVCVASNFIAIQFGQMFHMHASVNGYIPANQYMPQGFGQLGCSGFIVVDGDGNFINKRTKAFLDYGEEAFRDVERILQQHYKPAMTAPILGMNASSTTKATATSAIKVSTYEVGSIFVLEGLHKFPELNGTLVKIEGFVPESGRYQVHILDKKARSVSSSGRIMVLPCSLAPKEEDDKSSSSNKKAKVEKQGQDDGDDLRISVPESVGMESMDSEHAECTDAINALVQERTLASLERVLYVLEEHFQHEEDMLAQDSRFAPKDGTVAANSSFSALASHKSDHERILRRVRNEAERLKSASTSSSSNGGC